jgi:Calcineurin-like phosphoesterase
MLSHDPGLVIVCGDTHGNIPWMLSQMAAMRVAVPEDREPELVVIHVGDFGFWPGSDFPGLVNMVARELRMRIWVTPGNHEDYRSDGEHGVRAWTGTVIEDNNALVALHRGTRWTWHGLHWLSAGGATSPDRSIRTEGHTWWPEEELTRDEVRAAIAGGPADVLVTHDVGTAVDLSLPPWPSFWAEDERRRAERHRELVQDLADGVAARWWLHGHYHKFHQSVASLLGARDVFVTGLSNDGTPGNWGVLNVRTMTWERFST